MFILSKPCSMVLPALTLSFFSVESSPPSCYSKNWTKAKEKSTGLCSTFIATSGCTYTKPDQ